MRLCHLPDSTGLANAPGAAEMILPDYCNTTFFKKMMNIGGGFYNGSFSGVHTTMFALWHSTAAINRLTLIGNSNFIAGTVVSLYGVM